MRRRFSNVFFACVAAALLVSTAAHAEKMKNPEYAKWEKFKPGAFARLEGNGGSPGHVVNQKMTITLLELTVEKAVIETKMALESYGRKFDTPAEKREIRSTVETGEAAKTDDTNDNGATVSKSSEKLTIGEKTYDCQVTEVVINKPGAKVTVKTWWSEEVPGGQVRIDRTIEGKSKPLTTSMLIAEMKSGQ